MIAVLNVVSVREVVSKKDGTRSQVCQAVELGDAKSPKSLNGVVEFFTPRGTTLALGQTVSLRVVEFRGLWKGVAQLSVAA